MTARRRRYRVQRAWAAAQQRVRWKLFICLLREMDAYYAGYTRNVFGDIA